MPSGFTLSVQLDDTAEAERIFGALSERGRIVMPLEQTFWAARFGMPPLPADFGRSAAHTREQVRVFRASPELLLNYHDATYERTKDYLQKLSADELARELNEPQYQPLPTVAVRLVSVLENAMTNQGQIAYLKAYHRLGGWFPQEGKNAASFR